MSRTQKKCLIASAAVHTLLVLILLFGAALMPEAKPVEAATTLHVFDPSTVSMVLASHGGNPDARAASQPAPVPPAAPKPPTPTVQPPQPRAAAEPPKPPEIPKPVESKSFFHSLFDPVVRPPSIDPDAEPAPAPKKPQRKVQLDPTELQPVHKKTVKRTEPDQTDEESDAREQARAAAAARRRAQAISQAASEISQRISTDTHIDANPGVGGGGPGMANYWDVMASTYLAAWVPPANLEDELATVTVLVTVTRDGTVKNAHVTKSSGNAAMDQSIRLLLENQTVFPPFPPGTEEEEKTHYFRFNLSAKKSLG